MTEKQDQCQFYLEKKKRLCRFRPRPGETYCPEHACVQGIQLGRKRIPCPLNPKHNCYEDDLQNHLKKCPVTKKLEAVSKLPCYVKDINLGAIIDTDSQNSSSKKQSVKDLTNEKLGEIIERVNKLYKDYKEDIGVLHLEHGCVKEHMGNTEISLKDAFGEQVVLKKELLQQASLVGQLDHLGFLSQDHCFVELGAGKGKLSHWIQIASRSCTGNSFVLVDRDNARYKMDLHHRGEGDDGKFHRIKIDIKDLHLGKAPEIQAKSPVVVVGKHLCGGATDMGIRCAVDTLDGQPDNKDIGLNNDTPGSNEGFKLSNSPNTAPSAEAEDAGSPPAKVLRMEEERCQKLLPEGIMIALCCHHRCTWETYVGRDFMRQINVGPEDFDILARLSSWATCARVRTKNRNVTSTSSDENQAQTAKATNADDEGSHSVKDLIGISDLGEGASSRREELTVSEKEDIGRKCKRIIDKGRLLYLRSKGMNCFLREYVDEHQTPENIVLIATHTTNKIQT